MRRIEKQKLKEALHDALPGPVDDSLKRVYRGARVVARRNPGRGRVLPDFLIIGSMKSGTTSVHGWLTEHPFVAPTKKDIHFFSVKHRQGADLYRSYFPHTRDRDAFASEHGRPFICGEATASYLADYWTPRRAADLVPNARLVACLREPADRAYSQYTYFRKWGKEPLETFEEAIAWEEKRLRGEESREISDARYHSWRIYQWGYLRTGRYAEHLERWLYAFPREQLLLLRFEDVVAEPERTLERVHEHLGLPPHRYGELPVLNAGSYEPMVEGTREQLRNYFKPHNERLCDLTGIDFDWS